MTHALKLAIPAGVAFSDLKLTRAPDGAVSFDWAPVEAICTASGIEVALFRDQPEDNVAALLSAWYAEDRRRGGAADPVMDDLIAEATAEDRLGAGISYPPGRA